MTLPVVTESVLLTSRAFQVSWSCPEVRFVPEFPSRTRMLTSCLPTAPITSPWSGMADDGAAVEEVEAMDSSLLPPG